MKKGQKQEPPDTKSSIEKTDDIEQEEEEDDSWFTVKPKPDTLEEINIDLPDKTEKEKKLTKAKLAKKLRKKNLLINKRIEYDEEGNVSSKIIIL